MDKVAELNRASQILLEMEIKLRAIRMEKVQTEKELSMLKAIEANLVENISFLKSEGVITMILEYEKAISALETCRKRQAFLREDLEDYKTIENRAQSNYDRAKEVYEEMYDIVHRPKDNLIKIDFGSKNGK